MIIEPPLWQVHLIFIFVEGFFIIVLIIFALGFGGLGIILLEDEIIRDEWTSFSKTFIWIGAISMGGYLFCILMYTTVFQYAPILNSLFQKSFHRFSYFVFFISGFYAAQNMSTMKGGKNIFVFILGLISLVLIIFNLFFKALIIWPFLIFPYHGYIMVDGNPIFIENIFLPIAIQGEVYLVGVYFGAFFLFQSTSFFVNAISISRKSTSKSRSQSIISWLSLLWLIGALFAYENHFFYLDYVYYLPYLDTGFPQLFLSIIFIVGFLIGLRYFKQSKKTF